MMEFPKYAADLIRHQVEQKDLVAAYQTAYFCYQIGRFANNISFANEAARICQIIQKIINKKGMQHDA